jgi:hypothetical protein
MNEQSSSSSSSNPTPHDHNHAPPLPLNDFNDTSPLEILFATLHEFESYIVSESNLIIHHRILYQCYAKLVIRYLIMLRDVLYLSAINKAALSVKITETFQNVGKNVANVFRTTNHSKLSEKELENIPKHELFTNYQLKAIKRDMNLILVKQLKEQRSERDHGLSLLLAYFSKMLTDICTEEVDAEGIEISLYRRFKIKVINHHLYYNISIVFNSLFYPILYRFQSIILSLI